MYNRPSFKYRTNLNELRNKLGPDEDIDELINELEETREDVEWLEHELEDIRNVVNSLFFDMQRLTEKSYDNECY